MIERKVGFIGAGLMAETLAQSMLRVGVARTRNVLASDASEERRNIFAEKIGARVFSDNKELMRTAEVIVLSVKPQVLPLVVEEISPLVTPNHMFVSIAAGIPLQWLQGQLRTNRVARVMPNTPALVGAGAAAFCKGAGIDERDTRLVQEMFSSVGICVELDEKLIDAVTGLSGSGPAYIYLVIEALSDGGVKMGLPRAIATRLAAQTVLGAAKMVLETGKHPCELKDQVTTPGGATIEGVHALEDGGVRKAFMDAVEAATLKCQKLAKKAESGT